jgi:hypothetical protein
MAWRCGKCDGLPVPEHHRTCALRTTPVPTERPIRVDASTPEKQAQLVELLRRDLPAPSPAEVPEQAKK